MSQIIAQVQEIQSIQNLNLLSFTCNKTTLNMMSLDLSDMVMKDSQVMLTCKPTAIAIGKNIQGELSFTNQLHVKILSIESGELLSVLKLQFEEFILESIITADSQKRMQLQVGDKVVALIKSSDLSIAKVFS